MGRRSRKRQRVAQEAAGEAPKAKLHNEVQDPALRLLALHPTEQLLAVVVGSQLKLANLRSGEMIPLEGMLHTGALRVCEFDTSGKLLLSGGDDKVAKLWNTSTGACIATMPAPKKISAGVFSPDSQFVLFADKFGDVLVAKAAEGEDSPKLLLSHFASFIMSLQVTPDQRYIVSCDRDSKIRVSKFPADPLQGAYEIESFCLGHSTFVTDSALLPLEHETLLLSAGGDGTVRLWRPSSGVLLHSLRIGQEREPATRQTGDRGDLITQGLGETAEQGMVQDKEIVQAKGSVREKGNGAKQEEPVDGAEESAATEISKEVLEVPGAAAEEVMQEVGADRDADAEADNEKGSSTDEEDDDELAALAQVSSLGVPPRDLTDYAPVLCIAVAPDRQTVAAIIEGEQEVVVLTFDPENLTLRETARVGFPDLSFPASAAFDAQNRLWVGGGVPLQTSAALHIGVAHKQGEKWVACTEDVLDKDLRAALEARDQDEEKALQAGIKFEWYSEHLKKKSYTQEELEFRKRQRNDFKEATRLAALKKATLQSNEAC